MQEIWNKYPGPYCGAPTKTSILVTPHGFTRRDVFSFPSSSSSSTINTLLIIGGLGLRMRLMRSFFNYQMKPVGPLLGQSGGQTRSNSFEDQTHFNTVGKTKRLFSAKHEFLYKSCFTDFMHALIIVTYFGWNRTGSCHHQNPYPWFHCFWVNIALRYHTHQFYLLMWLHFLDINRRLTKGLCWYLQSLLQHTDHLNKDDMYGSHHYNATYWWCGDK